MRTQLRTLEFLPPLRSTMADQFGFASTEELEGLKELLKRADDMAMYITANPESSTLATINAREYLRLRLKLSGSDVKG